MTVFTEVANIVNNRPLTANSDNVKDFEALTPESIFEWEKILKQQSPE